MLRLFGRTILGLAILVAALGASPREDLVKRINDASRDAIWLDTGWKAAYKGTGVTLDQNWRLTIGRLYCINPQSLTNWTNADPMDPARCDAHRDGWHWNDVALSAPLMRIVPDTITIVAGSGTASGHVMKFKCGAEPCWGDSDAPSGIFCRSDAACQAAAEALKALIALGQKAGASAAGEILPKTETVMGDDFLRELQKSTYGPKDNKPAPASKPVPPPAAPQPAPPKPASKTEPPPRPVPVCDRILGVWDWRTDQIPGVLTFAGDHSVQASQSRAAPPVLQGFWSCDETSGAITIQWTNGVVETVAFGTDKLSVSGSNNYGSRVTGRLIR